MNITGSLTERSLEDVLIELAEHEAKGDELRLNIKPTTVFINTPPYDGKLRTFDGSEKAVFTSDNMPLSHGDS